MWRGIGEAMKVTKGDCVRTKLYLQEHMTGIAEDNLRGQCTKGHSCKRSSKVLLKKLLEQMGTYNDTAA